MSNNVAGLPNAISNEEVDRLISAFKTNLENSKAGAQAAAVAALCHCYQHRTAGKLRDLLAVIETEGKGFVRRAPYTLWLVQFAPVKMVTKESPEGKKTRVLEFDKESALLANADAVIATAAAKLWWTMSQDKEASAFDLVSFDKKMLAAARKALRQIDESINEFDASVRVHVAGIVSQFERAVAADAAAVAKVAVAPAAKAA